MMDHSVSVYQARYATSIEAKYLENTTVKKRIKFYNTNFPSDMISTNDYVSTSDEQLDKLTR